MWIYRNIYFCDSTKERIGLLKFQSTLLRGKDAFDTTLSFFRGIYKSRRLVLYQQINKLPLVSLRSLALFYIGVAQEGPVKQLELQKELMGGLEVRREPLVKVALCEGHICTDRQIRYSILVFFSLLRWGIPQNNMNIMNVKVMINHDKPLFSDKPIRSYVCAF